jgi:hypothetical protein
MNTTSEPVEASREPGPSVSPPTSSSPADLSPQSAPPKSQPPPLPESARRVTASRAAAEALFADRMIERLAASDYAGALTAAEALLVHQPLNDDARDCAQIARSELRKLYVARLGSLGRVPHIAVGLQGLLSLSLDFRAGFLLSRVDKQASLAQIVDACGLPQLDSLRILSELYLQRVINLED